jgi:hypothetical protein
VEVFERLTDALAAALVCSHRHGLEGRAIDMPAGLAQHSESAAS